MSQNISMPAARVPLVDDRGQITREWMQWFIGMFQRAGGAQGFSNSELYGDAVALQSYDELLERIATLEAQSRSLMQGMQMLAMGQMDQGYATPPQAVSPDTFARIKVLGETDLAVERGRVRIGKGINGSTAKLQVEGDADISGGTRVRADLQVDGNTQAATYRVGVNQVVGARQAGVTAYSAYPGQTIGASYTQSQVQATDTAIKNASAKLAQVVTALRTHGLIGD